MPIKVKFGLESTESHLWFPTYELINKLIFNSKFKNAKSIEWIQANIKDSSPLIKDVPYKEVFNVKRSINPFINNNKIPTSLIVDIIK